MGIEIAGTENFVAKIRFKHLQIAIKNTGNANNNNFGL